jgi:hypothetical protein
MISVVTSRYATGRPNVDHTFALVDRAVEPGESLIDFASKCVDVGNVKRIEISELLFHGSERRVRIVFGSPRT